MDELIEEWESYGRPLNAYFCEKFAEVVLSLADAEH